MVLYNEVHYGLVRVCVMGYQWEYLITLLGHFVRYDSRPRMK